MSLAENYNDIDTAILQIKLQNKQQDGQGQGFGIRRDASMKTSSKCIPSHRMKFSPRSLLSRFNPDGPCCRLAARSVWLLYKETRGSRKSRRHKQPQLTAGGRENKMRRTSRSFIPKSRIFDSNTLSMPSTAPSETTCPTVQRCGGYASILVKSRRVPAGVRSGDALQGTP